MVQDIDWKVYLADDERYADIINGIGCSGIQTVKASDLHDLDTQTGFLHGVKFIRRRGAKKGQRKIKIRDMLRKAAFGINFAIIGIENQEEIDYSLPLRNMSYDTGEYEKQAAKIRREVRKKPEGLSSGEFLYGFRKGSRMYPVVTFILYSGTEAWDGPVTLHDILDFTDIPESIIKMIPDYRINLIEIRKLTDTSVFRTDVRQVFDFIRYSEDKKTLKILVEGDAYYRNMEEDAFDIVTHYTNASELIAAKDYYSGKEGKIDMCKAIKELIEDGRMEGREEGLRALVVSLNLLLPDFDSIYQAIIKNEDYSSVSREQVMKYYK